MITHLHTPLEVARWLQASGVRDLHGDSRHVRGGDAFVAWPGAVHDGRRYVAAALEAGALACVVEREDVDHWGFDDARIAAVSGLKAHAGEIAHHFYRAPSHELRVLAVTGTNGKTSTTWWTAQLLEALQCPCSVIGTLGLGRPGRSFESTGLTTPDPVTLQQTLRHSAEQGLQACAMEASSIGLVEGRLNATHLHGAAFLNLTQDHLDYHGTMAAYWRAKMSLFDWPDLRLAVVNVDDPYGAELAQVLQARAAHSGLDVWTLSIQGAEARLRVPEWTLTDTGLRFSVAEGPQTAAHSVKLPLVGEYNLYNLLVAMAFARALGYGLAQVVQAAEALTPVPGRMQSAWTLGAGTSALMDADNRLPLVLVDYAHTPDALEKALRALQPLALQRGGRLWCVVGCGGDRDPGKRPLMAAVAELEASQIILTSDNPRTENPLHILEQMRVGLEAPERAWVEPGRAAAIALAVARCDHRDVVLLAGKGHESYQEIAGVRHPFSDLEHAHAALLARAGGGAA